RKLIDAYGLREPILALASAGAPMLGTCAGMILLADRIAEGDAPVLPLLDVEVKRNAYGRQLDSFEADISMPIIGEEPLHGVFIRAPVVSAVGPAAEVLAVDPDGQPVAVRQGKVLATAFHPELTGDRRLQRLIEEGAKKNVGRYFAACSDVRENLELFGQASFMAYAQEEILYLAAASERGPGSWLRKLVSREGRPRPNGDGTGARTPAK